MDVHVSFFELAVLFREGFGAVVAFHGTALVAFFLGERHEVLLYGILSALTGCLDLLPRAGGQVGHG